MTNHYHPETLEHIRNPLPAVADWAGATSLNPPAYDPATESCRFVEGAWVVATTGPSVADRQAALLKQANALCDGKMATIKAGYPEEEVKTWDQQVREAEAYQANALATVPMLEAMAIKRGLTKADLAGRVMTKATAFADTAGQIVGRRQRLEDDISAITTTADADAVAADLNNGWPV